MLRTGRPKLSINQDLFETLCRLQCTRDEICEHLHVSEPTLRRWVHKTYKGQSFDAVFSQKRKAGFVSLRRAQYKLAESGNATMLIWLGKNLLGQTDKQEISGPGGGPIQTEHTFKDERDAAAYLLKSYVDQGLSEIEARTKLVESGMVDPADLPQVEY